MYFEHVATRVYLGTQEASEKRQSQPDMEFIFSFYRCGHVISFWILREPQQKYLRLGLFVG